MAYTEEERRDAHALPIKDFIEKYSCSRNRYYKIRGPKSGKRKAKEIEEAGCDSGLIELAAHQSDDQFIPVRECVDVQRCIPEGAPAGNITSFEFDFSAVENVEAPKNVEREIPFSEVVFPDSLRDNYVSAPSGLHAMNPAHDADDETRVILSKLRMYYCFFGDILSDRVIPSNAVERAKWIKSLPGKGKEELSIIYSEVISVINSNNSFMLAKNGYLTFCHIFEKIAPFIGGDLDGFSTSMSQNKEVDDILKQIVIENFESFSSFLTPKSRLIAATAQNALKCDSYNQAVRLRKEKHQREKDEQEKVDEDIAEEKSEIPT